MAAAAREDGRALLGAADPDDATLTAMVADLLGAPVSDVREVRVEPVAYDTESITTYGRHWVAGVAETDDGPRAWRMLCKQVQSWERHPAFSYVPPEFREQAAAGIRWRTEGRVYASDLADLLPPGLSMPRALGVVELDELSMALWLPALTVRDAPRDAPWEADAARLLGRFAGSAEVRAVLAEVGHGLSPWEYLHGRLALQVVPALGDPELWTHPLLAATFDEPLRADLLAAAARAEALTAELADLPVLASHGDACPGNLLSVDGLDEVVLIDFGFTGLGPVGFDLGQLLVGDVQEGRPAYAGLAERDELLLAAYCAGLAEEGVDLPADVVRRAHALQTVLWVALSTPPDVAGLEPGEDGLRVAAARAAVVRYALDLLAETD